MKSTSIALGAGALLLVGSALAFGQATKPAKSKNNIVGTWRLVGGYFDPQGANTPIFGAQPNGLLIFTEDLHFCEVLRDTEVPRFASGSRDQGTAAENKAAVIGSLGLYGTYTVDEAGNFSGEKLLGSTFPNWNGLARNRSQLTLTVQGNRMVERLTDPGVPLIVVEWERVK